MVKMEHILQNLLPLCEVASCLFRARLCPAAPQVCKGQRGGAGFTTPPTFLSLAAVGHSLSLCSLKFVDCCVPKLLQHTV